MLTHKAMYSTTLPFLDRRLRGKKIKHCVGDFDLYNKVQVDSEKPFVQVKAFPVMLSLEFIMFFRSVKYLWSIWQVRNERNPLEPRELDLKKEPILTKV